MLVVKGHKKLILNLRDPERITTVIPGARSMVHKGQNLVSVPHGIDEVRVLRNLGIQAPYPVGYYYDFPGGLNPFAHQLSTVEFLTTNERAFCLNGMGTGKTISVLWAFDYLRKHGRLKRMLVISPLSTLERTWGDEIFKSFPDMTFGVMHGTRENRHKILAHDFDVYIINHDGIKSKETLDLLIAKQEIDLVVVDEIASFRNARTERFKALKRLTDSRRWVWGLTGTPTPNAPTDAWAQCRIISPGKVPSYFTKFRDTVMRQITPFKWGPRDAALDVVRQSMQPAIRFAREDCIDLPPTTYVTRHVELTPEQKKAYNEMMRSLKTEIAGGQVVALNEAVKLGKLVQVCCGAVYAGDETVVLPAGPRIELVREIIEEASGKVIVFVPLTGALENVRDELAKDFSVEVVHGATPRRERDRIFAEFQSGASPRVLVANAATMSHGLTLTAASVVCWYAPPTSNETYQQACARIIRPGQKRNTLIVNIESTPIERTMYSRLQNKEKLQGALLEMLK